MIEFLQLFEMAAPNEALKSKTFYHGCAHEDKAMSILQSGRIEAPDLSDRPDSHLRPMEGKSYLTMSLPEAITYAMGGVFPNGMPQQFIDEWGQYGYVFEIDGSQLTDVLPDEDKVGELAMHALRIARGMDTLQDIKKYYKDAVDLPWLADLVDRYMEWYPHHQFTEVYEDMDENEFEETMYMDDAIMSGEYAAWAWAGKLLMHEMTDEQHLELIQFSDNVAHQGGVSFSKAWKLDKALPNAWKSAEQVA